MNLKFTNIFFLIAMTLAWVATFYQGIVTAIDVWTVSEIFNHCYLVIPGAIYLILQKRELFSFQYFQPNYWLIIPLLGTLFLYTFGYVGDIRLFMHLATFTSLPLFIWMIIGNKLAKQIAFPLYFMLFAIPVGEQLIPHLQELTTNLAVPLIELAGVPIFRNGLYLDIPEGRFLVAEACSGISFLIASIMFGNLYAYLSFKSLPKQLLFVVISIVVPIAANAIRVFGIVLTAHLSDMEYAVGADHLIYGGVFYAFVLFLLIFIGERFRDKDLGVSLPESTQKSVDNKLTNLWLVASAIFTMLIMQVIWIINIDKMATRTYQQSINVTQFTAQVQIKELMKWRPSFSEASKVQQGTLIVNQSSGIDYFIATYDSGKGELISSLNKLYDAQRWTLLDTKIVKVPDSVNKAKITSLISPTGEKRIIINWYQIADKYYSSEIKAKLFQTANLLFGQASYGSVVAFSLQDYGSSVKLEETLLKFIEENSAELDTIVSSK